jgi:tRNA(Ile2)-agmatinylcytidine synthase
MPLYHLGLDDTDSLKLGCTTYIGALLIARLQKDSRFTDYPNLIRLNPNIPWKSRGNAGICLRFESKMSSEEILDMTFELTQKYRDQTDEKNQPGIALLEGTVTSKLKEFGQRALYDVITLEEAIRTAKYLGIRYRMIRGGRGLIGALASIGNTLELDYTFELIVYRKKALWGKKREIDYNNVIEFDKSTQPRTFNNIDYEERRLLITPHGPDPILFGVRGEDPAIVMSSLKKIKFKGGERWVVYRSNQGTATHLTQYKSISELKPYQAAVIDGEIYKKSITIKGGHVIGFIQDQTGKVDIAGYEPSGNFRIIVKYLIPKDVIRAYGGVRLLSDGKLTFNLEKLEVLSLSTTKWANPLCPTCGKRMKSEGKNKGFQCERCGTKRNTLTKVYIERKVSPGIYLPPPRAMRHLTKPFQRYGREKSFWDSIIGTFYGQF